MVLSLRRAHLVFPSAALLSFAVLAVGCGRREEGVESYRVPKPVGSSGKNPRDAGGEYRILGAMYPADNPEWFLKLTGPAELVAKYETDFDKLAESVQLRPGSPLPLFTLPDGWKLAGPRSIHAETIRLPEGGLEVTVTASAGGTKQNVDRWVGQVGQKVVAGDSANYTRQFDAVGAKGLRVDVRGPKNPAAGGMGPMMGAR